MTKGKETLWAYESHICYVIRIVSDTVGARTGKKTQKLKNVVHVLVHLHDG